MIRVLFVGVGACWLVFAASLSGGCAIKPKTYKMYAGPERIPAEMVILRESDSVQVVAIDGEHVPDRKSYRFPTAAGPGDRPLDIFHLEPGRHRVEVRVFEVTSTSQLISWTVGVNAFTFDYEMEAGTRFTWELQSELVGKKLVGVPILLETRRPSDLPARPLRTLPTVAPKDPEPPAEGEGAVVIGFATTETANATGDTVWLLRDNVATRALVKQRAEALIRDKVQADDRRLAASKQAVAYGLGFFEFRDVPVGDWILVWGKPPVSGAGLEKQRILAANLRVVEGDRIIGPVPIDVPAADLPEPAPETTRKRETMQF